MPGWDRIEAMTRATGMSAGLEARVADPLWLLARQWQVGEFHGEDAAQPAAVRITGHSVPLTSFRASTPGSRPARLAGVTPLEAVAEASAVPAFGGGGLHGSVRAGRRLTRVLRDAGFATAADTLRRAFPPSAPEHAVTAGSGGAAADLLVRHGLDGAAVAAAEDTQVRAVLAGVLAADVDAAAAVVESWRAWYRARSGTVEAGAWDSDRLGYRFSLAASGPEGEVTLLAPDHDGGPLDWPAFDVSPGPPGAVPRHGLGAAPAGPWTRTAVPAPVRYAGMPASRFWEFEEGEVNFGDVAAGPADLARVLVTEFATVYGVDWFVVPLHVDAGTLTELTTIDVVDTFSGRIRLRSTAAVDAAVGLRAWRLFELTGDDVGDGHPSPWLLVPPTAGAVVEGPPLERVALVRDEAANLVWGIEHIVEGPFGRGVDRAEAWGAANVPGAMPATATPTDFGEAWRYRLESDVPPWWIPLVPERIDPDADNGDVAAQVRLRRARMRAWSLLAEPTQAGPRSLLLDPTRPRRLAEEEVPSSGVRVERGWRSARWLDGSLHLWHGWRVAAGRGEAASGLRWDLLDRQAP